MSPAADEAAAAAQGSAVYRRSPLLAYLLAERDPLLSPAARQRAGWIASALTGLPGDFGQLGVITF